MARREKVQIARRPQRLYRTREREIDVGTVLALTPVGLPVTASQQNELPRTDAFAIGKNVNAARLPLASMFGNERLTLELFAHDALVLQQDKLLLDFFASLNAHNSNQVIASAPIC